MFSFSPRFILTCLADSVVGVAYSSGHFIFYGGLPLKQNGLAHAWSNAPGLWAVFTTPCLFLGYVNKHTFPWYHHLMKENCKMYIVHTIHYSRLKTNIPLECQLIIQNLPTYFGQNNSLSTSSSKLVADIYLNT